MENNNEVQTAPAAKSKGKRAKKAPKKAKAAKAANGSTKRDMIIALVSRKSGASLSEIMKAAKWQAHSVRGFLSTLGKTMKVESERKGDERVYRAH